MKPKHNITELFRVCIRLLFRIADPHGSLPSAVLIIGQQIEGIVFVYGRHSRYAMEVSQYVDVAYTAITARPGNPKQRRSHLI